MATADPPRPASSHPAFLLSQLGFFVKSRFSARLEPLGINPRQFETLRLLSQTSGLTQQHVGESLNIHRNVMVGLVDELEERELTERRRHPHDRRAYEVHVLPAGRKVFAKAEQILDEFEHTELLDTLSAAERQTLGDLLRRVSTATGLHPDVHPAAQAQDDHTREATSDR